MHLLFKRDITGGAGGPLPESGSEGSNGSVPLLHRVDVRENSPKNNETNTPFESTGIPLAQLAGPAQGRLLNNKPDPIVLESYRRLRTKLLQLQVQRPFRSLVVTSPSAGEGKTLTCINLGISLAMIKSLRILLVDGDLRRGTLGRYVGAEDRIGLSNLLDGSATLDNSLLEEPSLGNISLLLRGTSAASAPELLNSHLLKAHMSNLADRFDFVIVDSPPVNLLTDVQLIASSCDAVLLIARAFSTSRKSLEHAVQDLAQFNLIAAVLNGGTTPREYKKYRAYYSLEAENRSDD